MRFVVGENSASFKPISAHLSAMIIPGPACTEKRAILLPPAAPWKASALALSTSSVMLSTTIIPAWRKAAW
ncbi:MAG: hypothetical protein NT134_00275 [Chloroflexi bacterium]|nr:hypothetical protein [Chloroflexota bacterium]